MDACACVECVCRASSGAGRVVDGCAVEVQQAEVQARFVAGLRASQANPAIILERVAAAKARVWLMHVMAVGLQAAARGFVARVRVRRMRYCGAVTPSPPLA